MRRTRTKTDAKISPFLIDPSQVYHHRPSRSEDSLPTRTEATWLHLPVLSRQVSTRAEALHEMSKMSRLRHPNLELFLGVVADRSASVKCVLTEHVRGPSLQGILGWSKQRRSKFLSAHLLYIALDISRALVYLHSKTGEPHSGVCADAVIFDQGRSRAVLLLSGDMDTNNRCTAPETISRGVMTEKSDAFALALLIMQMISSISVHRGREMEALPKALRRVLNACLLEDPRQRHGMEDLCQELTNCCDQGLTLRSRK